MRATGYLIDLDGTLITDRKPLRGAVALLRQLDNFAILSNDAEHTPTQLSELLNTLDLRVRPEQCILAGSAALELIATERSGARVMLLASRQLARHGARLGLNMQTTDPEIVVLGRDRDFNYQRLSAAANAIRRGADLIVANPDLSHPGGGGRIVPETGALLAAILASAGPVPYRTIGKPESHLFELGLRRLGVRASDAVMIGDNPLTDGEGARRAGIRYIAASEVPHLLNDDSAMVP